MGDVNLVASFTHDPCGDHLGRLDCVVVADLLLTVATVLVFPLSLGGGLHHDLADLVGCLSGLDPVERLHLVFHGEVGDWLGR